MSKKKKYKIPAICWLKVTDFMHGWVQHELGGEARIREQRVVCIQHLPGAREVLRMETTEELPGNGPTGNSISGTWRNALDAGLRIDPSTMERDYGVTKERLLLYMPVECPPLCMTKNGILRPWTLDVNFGVRQATAVQRLLRDAFWQAVADFADEFEQANRGEKYAQIDMIKAFCRESETPDLYTEPMRREWQRRQKRGKE